MKLHNYFAVSKLYEMSCNLPLIAAKAPNIGRWYQEDQVLNIVLSEPMQINQVSEITLRTCGELRDVLGGSDRIVAVVIQRPYMRQVVPQL